MDINLKNNSDESNHVCSSHRDGDWIIFTCGHCPSYERRVNWRTGDVSTKGGVQHIKHSGQHFPKDYLHALTSLN